MTLNATLDPMESVAAAIRKASDGAARPIGDDTELSSTEVCLHVSLRTTGGEPRTSKWALPSGECSLTAQQAVSDHLKLEKFPGTIAFDRSYNLDSWLKDARFTGRIPGALEIREEEV